mgnify:CR=1 FL=1
MNKQVEANLSMVVSKALGGLNMNALKYSFTFVDSSCDQGLLSDWYLGPPLFGLLIYFANPKTPLFVRNGSFLC